MSEKKKTTITADRISMEQLKSFCCGRGISMNQFILDAVAEKLERNGVHFFWLNHKEAKTSDKDKVLNNDVIDYFQQPKYSWFVGLPCSEQETAE